MAGDKENQSGERDQEKTRKGEIERDREQGKDIPCPGKREERLDCYKSSGGVKFDPRPSSI